MTAAAEYRQAIAYCRYHHVRLNPGVLETVAQREARRVAADRAAREATVRCARFFVLYLAVVAIVIGALL